MFYVQTHTHTHTYTRCFKNRQTLIAYSTHSTDEKKVIELCSETLPFQIINTFQLEQY